jgi:Skp family chaperone for outer membrane proteins
LQVEREQGKFRELEEDLQKEENDFTRRQGRLSDDQRRRERNELDKRRADLKKSQMETNRKLKEEDVQLMQNIRSDIQRIANTLREKEGYLVILDRKSVFALPAASDLTEKVTRIYDAMKNAK